MTLNGFSKQIYFFWPRQIQKNIGKVFKKPQPPKKVNRPSDRKLKKMGAQNRNHISKMSRFRVTGQKGDLKKGPKS